MTSVLMDHDSEQSATVDRASADRRWMLRGSAAYIAAWLVGLSMKPAGVTTADANAAIVGHYVDHRAASIVQVLLVHAVAAAALLVFAVGLSRVATSQGQDRVARWCRRSTGIVVLASLVQAVMGVVMITTAGSVASSTTRDVLLGIEGLDALKLLALAGLCGVGVALARRGVLVRWTARLAAAAAVCLVAAAVALAGLASALAPMAVPALVLLLLWVGVVGFTARRVRGVTSWHE